MSCEKCQTPMNVQLVGESKTQWIYAYDCPMCEETKIEMVDK